MIVELNLAFKIIADGPYTDIRKDKEATIRKEILNQMQQVFKDIESYPSISGLDISFHSLNLVEVVDVKEEKEGEGTW